MNTENHSQTAAFIWSVADLLRGDFKQSQYGRVILPFTLLRAVLMIRLGQIVSESRELEKEAEKTIGLLQERRSALISATVTGKIDLRNWQPPADNGAVDPEVTRAWQTEQVNAVALDASPGEPLINKGSQ